MYALILILHSYGRWLVILAGFAALFFSWRGLIQDLAWAENPKRWGRMFSIAVDIQLLLGAALYLLFSPMTTVALNVADGLPPGSELRFFGVYHGLIMTAVFIGVHVSSLYIRRGPTDRARCGRGLVLYSVMLLILLCAIPWWRPWLRT